MLVQDPGAERVLPMDAYRRADRRVVHVDLLDTDPRTASVAVEGDVLTVIAARTSGNSPAAGTSRSSRWTGAWGGTASGRASTTGW
jgi:hypothetical protein